jgi:hypothetical protein
MDLLGILKLVRIRRLPQLIARLNMKEDTKAIFKVIQVSFFLILYLHIVCCSWWFAVKYMGIWIPPMEVGAGRTDVSINILIDSDIHEARPGIPVLHIVPCGSDVLHWERDASED